MNDEKTLVSIIIPVYNNEKCVEGCINSALKQTYENIEVIAVNDGSSDRSGEIIESLCKKHKNLVCISQPNAGVSAARNAGIAASMGEVITFLDSDDELEKNAVEAMLGEFSAGYDFAAFSYRRIWIRTSECKLERKSYDREYLKNNFLSLEDDLNFVWAKLYRAYIIKKYNLKFNVNSKYSEDYEFNLEYINHIEKNILISDKTVYDYYISRSGEHEKRAYPAHNIDVVVRFYGGTGNMPVAVFKNTVKRYSKSCVNRTLSWYGAKKSAEYIRAAFEECGEYITDEILDFSFSPQQAGFLKKKDYYSFVKQYLKDNRNIFKDKVHYSISKKAVKLIEKARRN